MFSINVPLKKGNQLKEIDPFGNLAENFRVFKKMLQDGWTPNWKLIKPKSTATILLKYFGFDYPANEVSELTTNYKLTIECRTVAIANAFLDELYETDGAASVMMAIEGENRKTVLKHAKKILSRVLPEGETPLINDFGIATSVGLNDEIPFNEFE